MPACCQLGLGLLVLEDAGAGGRISCGSFGKRTQSAVSPVAGGSSSVRDRVALQRCTWMSILIQESAAAFVAVHLLKMLLFGAGSLKIVLVRVLSAHSAQCPLICMVETMSNFLGLDIISA